MAINQKLTISVLNVNQPDYGKLSLPLIRRYCVKHGYRLNVINNEGYNPSEQHPSWLKLLVGTSQPLADFVLFWDLDLIPTPDCGPIDKFMDFSKINLCLDHGHILRGSPPTNHAVYKHFRYNLGLVGIPRSVFDSLERIYFDKTPSGLPSYDQYHVNQWIGDNNIPVHELPMGFNFFFKPPSKVPQEMKDRHFKVVQSAIKNRSFSDLGIYNLHFSGVRDRVKTIIQTCGVW